ncbi:DoxX family protein [Streptomyces sp. NPDC091292]|uniref:DoxX family protein n=1 Tax=Streptomyces sp. NPDC091292 TaxID=3365991 RepID=UPI00380C3CA8
MRSPRHPATAPVGAPGHEVAALMLRATLGPMLIAHGWNKVRGPGGLDGTTGWFESLGLKPAAAHARMAAATELAAGAALTLGVAAPLPSAAAVVLMAVAARTDHRGKGFFVFKGGWEYTGVVAGAAVGLAALGHGRYSVDGLLRRRPGPAHALAAAGLGTAAAAALLALCYRPADKPQDDTPDDTSGAGKTT